MLHASAHTVYIPFGKHKNKSVADIYATDLAYLQWLADKAFVASWKEIATKALNGESIAEFANIPAIDTTVSNGVRTASLMLSETGKIIVKFAYNKHDPADVLFKDELKRCVEGLTWEGTPHFRWVVGFASLPKLVEAFGGKKNIFASQDVKDRYREEIQRRIMLDEVRQKTDNEELRKYFYNLVDVGSVTNWNAIKDHPSIQKYIKK